MCKELIEKARGRAGLTPDEALSLYDRGGAVRKLISDTAAEIKESYFGGSITLSAPLEIDGTESEAEIRLAAKALADIGHKRLILKLTNTFDAEKLSETVKTIHSVEGKGGGFSRIDASLLNAGAGDLRALKEAGIGTVSIGLHGNPETAGGAVDVVFGKTARSDLEALPALADRLQAVSLSRGAGVSDEEFVLLCGIVRLALPGAQISVRASEPASLRGELIRTCATRLDVDPSECVLDEVVNSLARRKVLSSFNTTEEKNRDYRFLNALLSMKEYIADFASMDTRVVGTDLILANLYTIGDAGLRSAVVRAMKDIRNGARGVRFS